MVQIILVEVRFNNEYWICIKINPMENYDYPIEFRNRWGKRQSVFNQNGNLTLLFILNWTLFFHQIDGNFIH